MFGIVALTFWPATVTLAGQVALVALPHDAVRPVTCAGTGSLNAALKAVYVSELLVTTIVYVSGSPRLTVAGPDFVMLRSVGDGFTLSDALAGFGLLTGLPGCE